jgi:outer membrane lipoprotein-sorting protein
MLIRHLAAAAMAALLFGLAGAAPARALDGDQKALLARVQKYVNSLTTVKTRFTQIAPNGQMAKGTIYLSRPGKLRIDFDPPSHVRIVTTSLWLVVYEGKNAEPQNYPLNSTPAGILVRKQIKFGGDLKVTALSRGKGFVRVRLIRANNPNQGSMTLVFDSDPIKLVGWIVADAEGQKTIVRLSNTQVGIKLNPAIFALRPTAAKAPGFDR